MMHLQISKVENGFIIKVGGDVADSTLILVVVVVEGFVELSHPLSPKQLTANLHWFQI